MSLLRKILGQYFILRVSYTGHEAFSMSLCAIGGDVAAESEEWEDVEVDGIKERVKKSLLLVVVGGYGVISKEISASSEIAAKVREDEGHYLWRESDGVITFVRAQQLEKFFAELDSTGVHSLGTLLVAGGGVASQSNGTATADSSTGGAANSDETLRLAEDFFARNATFKRALTPSETGSLVAMALFHRIKLPVLGIVLLALVANTMLSSGVRARYNVTSARLERLKESSEHDRELSQGRRQAMAEFSKGIGYRYAVLCDRIARAMPPRITLTQLVVQPLAKKIEEGRKPQIEQRAIVVSGTSPDPQSISAYVSVLQKQSFAGKVKLTSIEQNRDNPAIGFTITIEI